MKQIEAFIDAVIRFRWLVIVLTLAAVVGLGAGMSRLGFATDYRIFFGPNNPEINQFDEFQNVYTKNDNVFFVVQAPEGEDAFSPRMATLIEELTTRAWSLPFATRVDSISNFQHTYSDGDTLVVEDLVSGAAGMSPAELSRRREIALAEPTLVGNLISHDARTVGVNATIHLPGQSLTEVPDTTAAARAIVDEFRARHPDVRFALTGIVVVNNAWGEAGQADSSTLVPLMYLVMIVLAMVGMRSIAAAFVTFLAIVFSTIAAMGAAGYLGILLAPITIAAPNIILTLAIADCVHIVVSTRKHLRAGLPRKEAVRTAMRENFVAVFVTSLTTIIGFASLNFADGPNIQALGTITSIGIFAAWVLAVTLVPALLAVLPMRPAAQPRAGVFDGFIQKLGDFVIRRRTGVLAFFGAITIILTGLAATNQFQDSFSKYFDERLAVRQDMDFATEALRGPEVFEFALETGTPTGVNDPAYLRELDAFTEWARAQSEVAHVLSYADIIKRLNKNMHGDDPAFARLPDTAQEAAQYLLLYELSLPYGLDLNDRINVDRSGTRVSVTLYDVPTTTHRAFMDRAEAWIRANASHIEPSRPTGVSVMAAYMSQRNIESMISGTLTAALLIGVVIALSLRSLSMGFVSLIPNILPIAVTFGIWAMFVGEIGMAASIVGSTSLGVVVDDTVHFVTKYLHGRRALGLDRAEAVRYAYRQVSEAVIVTTLILAIGFSALAFSLFRINQQLGQLTAVAITVALFFELFLLPAILLIGYRGPRGANQPERIEHVPQVSQA
jgi:predicted RND superfamily exporter protein